MIFSAESQRLATVVAAAKLGKAKEAEQKSISKKISSTDLLKHLHLELFPAKNSKIVYPHLTAEQAFKKSIDKLYAQNFSLDYCECFEKSIDVELWHLPVSTLTVTAVTKYWSHDENVSFDYSTNTQYYEHIFKDCTAKRTVEYVHEVIETSDMPRNLNSFNSNSYVQTPKVFFENHLKFNCEADVVEQACQASIAEAASHLWANFENRYPKFKRTFFESEYANNQAEKDYNYGKEYERKNTQELVNALHAKTNVVYQHTYFPYYVFKRTFNGKTYFSFVNGYNGQCFVDGPSKEEGNNDYFNQLCFWMMEQGLLAKNMVYGTSSSMVLLAKAYLTGERGIPKSHDEAFYWLNYAYKIETELKLVGKIEGELANAYFAGLGTKQDYQKAFLLYKKSVQKFCYNSLLGLAKCYYFGYGTQVDFVEAKKHLEKALEKAELDANKEAEVKKLLEEASKKVTQQEAANAEKIAPELSVNKKAGLVVFDDGTNVRLDAEEMSLLCFLVSKRDKFVDGNEILDVVYGKKSKRNKKTCVEKIKSLIDTFAVKNAYQRLSFEVEKKGFKQGFKLIIAKKGEINWDVVDFSFN